MISDSAAKHSPASLKEEIGRFAIGFDQRDRNRLHELWDGVLDSGRWTEASLVDRFEAAWTDWNGADAVATSGWAGAALAALEFAGVRGHKVLCPSNTFPATPNAIVAAGAEPVFVDCNRDDLCASLASFEAMLREHRPKAAWLVHVGGHIAFEVEAIAELCRSEGVFLLEDCAHAHGASWNGRRAGTWGDAGVWSFYATKTVSTGEGGILSSRHTDLIDFAKLYRNYGKPDHSVQGLNFRMSEFTAALGLVQTERMEEIVGWKNAAARAILDPVSPARLDLPDGMTSGLYKYIVFDAIERSTGKVYDLPCHRLFGTGQDLPNSDWVADNHWCEPLYYRPEAASRADLEALA
jgi:dTDP-4-amino-4,6-dideoxygalactose transaminase